MSTIWATCGDDSVIITCSFVIVRAANRVAANCFASNEECLAAANMEGYTLQSHSPFGLIH